ncbi:MAG: gamma-glutamylcyclotransferase [Candidatus Thiodiazotropha sp. (ex Lucinoma kastoroae)]|nr:gamma-glutamylcyclotransferase [Candidatus Thiodiazotropha sp. (ex Lucinoma kastoroae)]
MTKSETFSYFSYGSNMLTARLLERTPSAVVVKTGHIKHRRLTFNKVSVDGSGKCDIEQTDKETDLIYGVIFKISISEKQALGKAEGVGKGYEEHTLDVETPEGAEQAITYIATRKEHLLRPYHWYKALVVCGAIEHKLPTNYIEWIRTICSKEDLDSERRAKNEAIIFGS